MKFDTSKLEKNNDIEFATKFRDEFYKDVQAAEMRHKMMNFHYLQYKGILYLNKVYGAEYLETIGLQVNVPRTFMTVEAIRPQIIDRQLDINVKGWNKKSADYKLKARDLLLGEFERSKARWVKADAQTDALIFGTGYALSKFVDDKKETDIFDGYDEEGRPKTKKGTLQRYKGMKLSYLNPYCVFRDRNATTNEIGNSGTWNHCYIYSIWDFDTWKEVCEAEGFSTEGMEKGGFLKEFDEVRRKIDTLYAFSEFKNRDDSGNTIRTVEGELQAPDYSESIMVVERFEEDTYSICSGANWTVNYKGENPDPDKTIAISVFRDYQIPGEFEGIGEPEALRWQQYEENKVHNLSYLGVLANTVQRYGIVKELLEDPTDVKNTNPLKPIYLKYMPNTSVNDAVQALNQGKGTAYPAEFLKDIKSIGQSATGISDGLIGASKMVTDTATEANLLQDASMSRINRKLNQMDNRDLVPTLDHWLVCIPHYYDEDLDMLITDGEDYYTKFIPYTREFNDNPEVVAMYAAQEGALEDVRTVEDVFLKKGYRNVIFVSDIINSFKITIKTVNSKADRAEERKELREVIVDMNNQNAVLMKSGLPPKYDTDELFKDLLRQYPDIIEDPERYIINQEQPPMPAPQAPVTQPAPEGMPAMPPQMPMRQPMM